MHAHTPSGKLASKNKVMDSLPRDLNLEVDELTVFLIFTLPEQVPQHFESRQLPREIDSFLIAVFHNCPGILQPLPTQRKKNQSAWHRWI
jgi:hypothetical protein